MYVYTEEVDHTSLACCKVQQIQPQHFVNHKICSNLQIDID